MWKEFKEFISKGNLVEIAVALILALAFAGLVTSFTENLINPIIGAIFGQPNFDSLTIDIGDAELRYGAFLTTLLNFVIVAFVLFLVVKAYNRAFPKGDPEAGPTEVQLLTEIRDELRRR
ncbi:MAG TPA: large conductance mechanosensitive channel protein MscL [Actinomycetota bacterium]|nr:large conductance mechanosensitive channel protein MscL [Actinomycetota bacterium]